jgi:hypothetical protein
MKIPPLLALWNCRFHFMSLRKGAKVGRYRALSSVPSADSININEIEKRWIIRVLWKEDTAAPEIQQRLKAVSGDSKYALSTIYEWMRNFHLGRTEIRDFHRSEGPRIDGIDGAIIFRVHIFPLHTVRTLTETLGVSPCTIRHQLCDSLGLQRYYFR